jgi:hypothetical protein
MESRMDNHQLQEDLFYLVGFLLSSAHGLYSEPAEYGVFRLMDTAGRLLEIMERHGLSDEFLQRLQGEIDEEKSGSMDDDRQKETINELVVEYTQELQRRIG